MIIIVVKEKRDSPQDRDIVCEGCPMRKKDDKRCNEGHVLLCGYVTYGGPLRGGDTVLLAE